MRNSTSEEVDQPLGVGPVTVRELSLLRRLLVMILVGSKRLTLPMRTQTRLSLLLLHLHLPDLRISQGTQGALQMDVGTVTQLVISIPPVPTHSLKLPKTGTGEPTERLLISSLMREQSGRS